MADELVRALLLPAEARLVVAIATETVAEGVRRHGLDGAGAIALGRALVAGGLLATMTKQDERVALQISGSGPLANITVDARGSGVVRGYVSPPGVSVPAGPQARPQVGAAVGRGQVSVARDLGLREQYRGSAALVTGEIDEDVEAYLRQSEQLDSALGCEVVLGKNGDVVVAAGVLVQALPGGAPDLVREVQHALRTQSLYNYLITRSGAQVTSLDLAAAVLPATNVEVRVVDVRPFRFRCNCSDQRATEIVKLLGRVEVAELLEAEGKADVTCNYCNEHYVVAADALKKILEGLAPSSDNVN